MLVKVTMKNGDLYEGVKCGSEGGFLYLVAPYKLTKDEEDALESLKVYKEIFEKLEEEERERVVLEDDNCENRGS